MANYYINTSEKQPVPPSQVGDGIKGIEWGETLVFTTALLSSMLTPPYTHPEGEPPANLLITALPSSGELKYNGVAVSINDIISFTDIDSGALTFTPDMSTNTPPQVSFGFEISDAVSNIFVG